MKKFMTFTAITLFWGIVWHANVTAVSQQAGTIEYRRAQEADIPAILDMLEEAAKYPDKVLVPPIHCRKAFVEGMIKNNYLFIALSGNKVVASKKLFIAEGKDKQDILENLLRAEGPKRAKPSYRASISESNTFTAHTETEYLIQALGVCIYDGLEYTAEAFRGKGINKELTQYAYATISHTAIDKLQQSPIKKITLLYGLTYPNAGMHPGISPDRTPGLANTFREFIKKYIPYPTTNAVNLELSRFNSFLPTFDPTSQDCKSIYLEEKNPIYGYTLTYTLQ